MSAMGIKIDQFDVPVCNAFQAKILNDQLCYEVDLQKFSDVNNIHGELKLGFNFLLDYNEDRQVTLNQENNSLELGLASSFDESEENSHAIVYLDTIGKEIFHLYMFENDKKYFNSFLNNIAEPVMLIGEGKYNPNDLKEIQATDAYVGLGKDVTNCQNEEPFFNCTTRHRS